MAVECPSARVQMVTSTRPRHGASRRGIGVVGLSSLVFFSVAGTPAGSEDTVAAAGPLLALLGFVLMPLVWSIPEALVTAELATAFPLNGGYVAWVALAWGETPAYMEALLKWLSGVLDNAIYPIMMLNYSRKVWPALQSESAGKSHGWISVQNPCDLPSILHFGYDLYAVGRLFIAATTLGLSAAQYRGMELVGTASAAVVVITLVPFVILVFAGIGKMQWSKLGRSTHNVDWQLYLQTLFWSLNYFDSVSTFAAEVEAPARTFPRALMIAMAGIVAMYLMVLGVAIGNAPDGEEWDNSELADAGLWIGGDWLRVWIVLSVCMVRIHATGPSQTGSASCTQHYYL